MKSAKEFYFAPGTFTPFNDQNTSIEKDYIMLYFKSLSAGRNLIFGQVILYAKWQKYMEKWYLMAHQI